MQVYFLFFCKILLLLHTVSYRFVLFFFFLPVVAVMGSLIELTQEPWRASTVML